MSRDYYEMLKAPYVDVIASSRPVDPDNGREAAYQQHMGSSDVLGIILALERTGYCIRRQTVPWRKWLDQIHRRLR